MDAVRRRSRPALRRPKAIIAFEGWNDACEAATGTVTYLLGRLPSDGPFATIEPEEFFDFQQHRPTIRVGDGATRHLEWPETRFYAIELPDHDHDLVLVIGNEPSHRWKTFSRIVASVLAEVGTDLVLLLGAYIGQVTHRQEVPLSGVGTDPRLVAAHGLAATDYEGPTGIVGVLVEACKEVGLPALGIWAATPHYLAANPNPSAMLAMARVVGTIVGRPFDLADLEALDREFRDRVDEAIGGDAEDLGEYLEELTGGTALGIDEQLTEDLVSEIERFLRGID